MLYVFFLGLCLTRNTPSKYIKLKMMKPNGKNSIWWENKRKKAKLKENLPTQVKRQTGLGFLFSHSFSRFVAMWWMWDDSESKRKKSTHTQKVAENERKAKRERQKNLKKRKEHTHTIHYKIFNHLSSTLHCTFTAHCVFGTHTFLFYISVRFISYSFITGIASRKDNNSNNTFEKPLGGTAQFRQRPFALQLTKNKIKREQTHFPCAKSKMNKQFNIFEVNKKNTQWEEIVSAFRSGTSFVGPFVCSFKLKTIYFRCSLHGTEFSSILVLFFFFPFVLGFCQCEC